MQPSTVTDLLFKQLNFRGEKQKVISTNIANIDTPDYKTKDLRFKTQLDKSNEEYQLKMFNTHAKHIELLPQRKESNLKLFEVQNLIEQNDGNNVNLDTQMSEMSKNNIMFKALENSIKKDSLWFKSIIEASKKN